MQPKRAGRPRCLALAAFVTSCCLAVVLGYAVLYSWYASLRSTSTALQAQQSQATWMPYQSVTPTVYTYVWYSSSFTSVNSFDLGSCLVSVCCMPALFAIPLLILGVAIWRDRKSSMRS
jgi:phosphotransferase system  glucose/maltose/N-acetylglucosamine-specific IIC component